MILPILPETVRVDLTDAGYPALVAVVRPMDLLDKATWFDAQGCNVETVAAMVDAVRRQLVTIEGLEAHTTDGAVAPFDGRNPAHFRSLPVEMVTAIYTALLDRTTVSETDRKN